MSISTICIIFAIAFPITLIVLLYYYLHIQEKKKEKAGSKELQDVDPKIPTIINRGEFYSVAYLGKYIYSYYEYFWSLSASWSKGTSDSFLEYDKQTAIYLYNRLMADLKQATDIENEKNRKKQLYDQDHFKVVKKEDL